MLSITHNRHGMIHVALRYYCVHEMFLHDRGTIRVDELHHSFRHGTILGDADMNVHETIHHNRGTTQLDELRR